MIEVHRKEIWVYGDHRNQRLWEQSLRTLGLARELAHEISGRALLVVATSQATEVAKVSGSVLVVEHPELKPARPDTHALALLALLRSRSPALLLFAESEFSRELAGRLARELNTGLIADCHHLHLVEGQVVASCPGWSGEMMAEITFTNPAKTGFITLNTRGLPPLPDNGLASQVERLPLVGFDLSSPLRLLWSKEETEEERLESAEKVVVAGAGLGSAEDFHLARELALALGAELGATRPVVLARWAEEERLIGQTGKTIRPRLLISLGTSGAVQYTAGIMEAETIVAINRDPEAPIFQLADLAVVADLKQLLPPLLAAVKKESMKKIAELLAPARLPGETKTGFGAKVRSLRLSRNWSVEDLAQATAQTPEFIEKVEAEEITPPVSFLLGLARAFKMDPADFLREEQKAAILDQRAKAFLTRTQNYSYRTLTPAAENERLRAFLVTIEPRQDHKPVAYKHEGEEFIYVLEGELGLTLGQKSHHLKPRDSIHFNSEIPHQLKSLSDQPTLCLVVLYTP